MNYGKYDHDQNNAMMPTNYPYPPYQEIDIGVGADLLIDKSAEFELAIDVIRSIALLTKP